MIWTYCKIPFEHGLVFHFHFLSNPICNFAEFRIRIMQFSSMMDRILGKNDLTETKKSTNGEKDKNSQVKQM